MFPLYYSVTIPNIDKSHRDIIQHLYAIIVGDTIPGEIMAKKVLLQKLYDRVEGLPSLDDIYVTNDISLPTSEVITLKRQGWIVSSSGDNKLEWNRTKLLKWGKKHKKLVFSTTFTLSQYLKGVNASAMVEEMYSEGSVTRKPESNLSVMNRWNLYPQAVPSMREPFKEVANLCKYLSIKPEELFRFTEDNDMTVKEKRQQIAIDLLLSYIGLDRIALDEFINGEYEPVSDEVKAKYTGNPRRD